MELHYLYLDREGIVVAEFSGLDEAVQQAERIEEVRQARGPLRLVRVDEYPGSLMSATSFVTATPLPQLLRERSAE